MTRLFFTICLLVTGLLISPDAHAADQGDAPAQSDQGYMYKDGQGVAQEDKKAVFWFRKAADRGNASAQFIMGGAYYYGQGVVQSYVQAHRWYNLAAANSTGERYEAAARNRSIVEEKMTPQQIAEAQRLAGEWQLRQP